jgi:hypothetical protein
VNLIGGIPQEYGADYIIYGNQLIWCGLGLDGLLEPGDNVRIIYKTRELSDSVKVSMSLKGSRLTARVSDGQSWLTVARRDMGSGLDGTWATSFFMDTMGSSDRTSQVGKGLVSDFSLVASNIWNSTNAHALLQKTERKSVIIYRDWT